jgi:hypothetical protein
MRFGRSICYTGAVVSALLCAALVDEATELLANARILGGDAFDSHQEAVLPVALAGLALLLILGFAVAFQARSGDRRSCLAVSPLERIAVGAATIAASAATVVLMETWESVVAGGAPVFGGSSVYVTHVPFVVVAYAVVAPVVATILRACLHAAAEAGIAIVYIFARFMHADRQSSALASRARHCRMRAFTPRPVAITGTLSLRAPPRRPFVISIS